MSQADLQELNDLYEEHWRLVYEVGQMAPAALLVRMRTLDLLRNRYPSPRVWAGFGYGIAERIVASAEESIHALDPGQAEELFDLLEYAGRQPARVAEETAAWQTAVREATESLRARYAKPHRPPGDIGEWIAVPIVYDVLGASRPEFADLSAVGVVWMRLQLEHVASLPGGRGRRRQRADGGRATSEAPSPPSRVRGLLDDETLRDLTGLLERVDALVPNVGLRGAPKIDPLAVRLQTYPPSRLRGRSLELPFLMELLRTRYGARPGRHALVWSEAIGASGVVDQDRVLEVSPLEEKLAAIARAGVVSVFVPGSQRHLAEKIVTDRELGIRVRGVDRTEELAAIPKRTSPAVQLRKRSGREVAAQSWFWYLRSPARVALLSLAALVVLGLGVALLWPVPASCDWEPDQGFVLRNWVGLPVARPRAGVRPGDEGSIGGPDAQYWELLSRGPFRTPVALVLCGGDAADCGSLRLFDWRGREIQRWISREDPSLTDTLAADSRWRAFYPRELDDGRRVVLAPLRTVTSPYTVLRVFLLTGDGLERRGFAWHTGHLESLARLDANDDGTPEDIAMGWANFLAEDGTERRDLERGERGRSVAYAIDLAALCDAEEVDVPIDSLPSILEPGAASRGLLAGWSFPLDGLTTAGSSYCVEARLVGRSTVRFPCQGGAGNLGVVEYTLRLAGDYSPLAVEASATDAYLDALRPLGWSADSVQAHVRALAPRVHWRGDRWRPWGRQTELPSPAGS